MNKIFVEIDKDTFEKALIKPACEKSRIFCCIAKQPLLDRETLKYIELLGYEVVQKHKNIELK